MRKAIPSAMERGDNQPRVGRCAVRLLCHLMALLAASAARAASVEVALDFNGVPVASNSPALSRDGRFVAFRSSDPNIVPDDTNHLTNSGDGSDIFVRDRRRCTTARVSIGPGGLEGDGNSIQPVISQSGRVVVFMSEASTLVPDGPGGNETRHLYLHDRQTRRTELVDVTPTGAASNSESPLAPYAVSANGRYVAFSSSGSDLVAGDTSSPGAGGLDVFVRDRKLQRTLRVSVTQDGASAGGVLQDMSEDGRFVLFGSVARLSPDDQDDQGDLYLRDLRNDTNRRINVVDGVPIRGPGGLFATLSDDGCVAVFTLGGTPGIAVYDCTRDSSVFEVNVGTGLPPVVAADGQSFAFYAPAGPLGSAGGVFVHDRATGVSTVRVPLEDAVLPPQFHLSGNGSVLATGSPVTVHGDLPAVPTACEYPRGCSQGGLPPLDTAACLIAAASGGEACAGDLPLALRLERPLKAAREAIRTLASEHQTGKVAPGTMRRVEQKMTRAAVTVSRSELRGVISSPCAQALDRALEEGLKQIANVR